VAAAARALEVSRPFAEEHAQVLSAELPMDPLWADADPLRVEQVLTNLLSNAKDATPAGGTVTVTTGLADEAERRWVSIAVADTGAGIPEAQRGRLFTPFHTTKEEGKGTGLGLSVSYGLIRGHGGTIRVESAVGRGSTFTVVLPVQG